MIKILNYLLILSFIYSCASFSVAESNSEKGRKFLAAGETGILVYSFSKDPNIRPQIGACYMKISVEGTNPNILFPFNLEASKRMSKDLDESKDYYYLSYTLKAGKYNINEFHYSSYPTSYFQVTKIPFEIIENEITYIGNFDLQVLTGKSLIGQKGVAGGHYNIQNLWDNDSIYINNKFRLPTEFPVNIQFFQGSDYPLFN